jgi:nucleoside 2-deoxyribosyltransferase
MEAHAENRTFTSGASRDGGKKPALHLISPHAMLRLGEWLRFACEDRKPVPYPKRNWEKGMPISECIASDQRHTEKYKLGDRSEDHLAAKLFNTMAMIHFEEEIKAGRMSAEFDDMPHYMDRTQMTSSATAAVPALENTVQAKLDEVFKNPDTVYASEFLPRGSGICIFRTPWGGRHARVHEMLEADAVATEDIPAGSPMAITNDHQARLISESATVPQIEPVYASEGAITEMPAPDVVSAPPVIRVYLCGPITGKEIDFTWRETVTRRLAQYGVQTLDPLRNKDHVRIGQQGLSYDGRPASEAWAFRDSADIRTADIVLAHFPYLPERQSIGSLMEMGAASIGLGKPVVLATAYPMFRMHLFCRAFCQCCTTLDQAIDRILRHFNLQK